ncbi:MAG: hypothetical protein NTZ26_00675 [Candidatus Aminicenantes bacterium]|nr:hypothetical protein [Candidatus Aminicenantes bacterium]
MKTDRRFSPALAAILLLASALAASAPAQAPAPTEKPAAVPPALIRMEYLKPRTQPAAVPKRDIFSPGRFEAPDLPGRMVGGKAVLPGTATTAEAAAAEAPPIPSVNLRFIGFIFNPSRNRIVGLILLDGIAAAVAEGESLANGLKIIRLTRRELETQGPDGKTLTFALEGVEK